MVNIVTILCQTSGNIDASTSTPLLDPMTGLNAVLPEGAAVREIALYRDGDNSVSSGCTIQFGTENSASKYISVGESISTNDLNSGHIIHKCFSMDKGLGAVAELRLVLSSNMNQGGLLFEVTYVTFA